MNSLSGPVLITEKQEEKGEKRFKKGEAKRPPRKKTHCPTGRKGNERIIPREMRRGKKGQKRNQMGTNLFLTLDGKTLLFQGGTGRGKKILSPSEKAFSRLPGTKGKVVWSQSSEKK